MNRIQDHSVGPPKVEFKVAQGLCSFVVAAAGVGIGACAADLTSGTTPALGATACAVMAAMAAVCLTTPGNTGCYERKAQDESIANLIPDAELRDAGMVVLRAQNLLAAKFPAVLAGAFVSLTGVGLAAGWVYDEVQREWHLVPSLIVLVAAVALFLLGRRILVVVGKYYAELEVLHSSAAKAINDYRAERSNAAQMAYQGRNKRDRFERQQATRPAIIRCIEVCHGTNKQASAHVLQQIILGKTLAVRAHSGV